MAARFSLPSFDGKEYIFVVMLGLFIGSTIGAMAQIIPYGMILLSGMAVAVLTWRQDGSVSIILIMVGLLAGSFFGNMASVMPYGITIFFGILLAVMIWRTQGGGITTSGPTSTIALILFIIISVGFLWSGTNQDFCNPTFSPTANTCLSPSASGYITAWQGCVSTCTITPFTFLGNSPLAFLLSGDFIGFIQSMISGSQSAFTLGPTGVPPPAGCNILTSGFLCWLGVNTLPSFWSIMAGIVTAAIGAILLFLGSGIGIQAQAATVGGTINENDAGTRTYQSLGIGLIMWAAVTSLIFGFGQWFGYIGFGLGSGTGSAAAGGAIYLTFLFTYTYELYRQGKTITA